MCQHALVTSLLAEDDEVVLYVEYRTVGNAGQLEDGTVATGVVVHERIVREGDVPPGVAFVLELFAELLLDEGRERTVVERVLDGLEVGQHVGLAVVAGTVNPAVAAGTVGVVAAVVEHVVLDKHVVPQLVVGTLFADEATDNAFERAVLDNQRVERHGHTVAEHVEEVVTGSVTDAGLLVAIVEALGVVEVDVVEGQFLHVDFTAFTSFGRTAEGEHGVGAAIPLTTLGALGKDGRTIADTAYNLGTLSFCNVLGVGTQHETFTGDVVAVEIVGLSTFQHEGLSLSIVGVRDKVVERRRDRGSVVLLGHRTEHVCTLGVVLGNLQTAGLS